MPDYLVFIDTNIFLDFYRMRLESGLKILTSLDSLHDKLITTYQVEMEFKKRRQGVILESLKDLTTREKVKHPAFLAESKQVEILHRGVDDTNKRLRSFRARLTRVLAHPTTSDPVYKVVQRLFVNNTPLNLNRHKKERQGVKRRALRRYLLGYPPRKDKDTSMGDALNWEWIVDVAANTGKDIAIVSRDADYGHELDQRMYLNDWLGQEFRDRVSKKRQIVLCNRLSSALKLLKVNVAKEAVEEEEQVAQRKVHLVVDNESDPFWASLLRVLASDPNKTYTSTIAPLGQDEEE